MGGSGCNAARCAECETAEGTSQAMNQKRNRTSSDMGTAKNHNAYAAPVGSGSIRTNAMRHSQPTSALSRPVLFKHGTLKYIGDNECRGTPSGGDAAREPTVNVIRQNSVKLLRARTGMVEPNVSNHGVVMYRVEFSRYVAKT